MSRPDSAIVAFIPEADEFATAFRAVHQPNAEPGMSAHVTILIPFVPAAEVTEEDLDRLTNLLSGETEYTCTFSHAGGFPRSVHLLPDDPAPFLALTDRITEEFPQYQPYGGRFHDPTPHLTVAYARDRTKRPDIENALIKALDDHGPVISTVTELTLMVRPELPWYRHAQFSLARGAT